MRQEANALQIVKSEFTDPPPRKWEPIKKEQILAPLPEFPIEAMPGILRDMAVEISESIQIPIEVAALELLVVTGAAAGRENVFFLRPELETRPNLYGFVFVERAGRKSSSFKPAIRPVETWIDERLPEYNKQKRVYNFRIKERDALEAQSFKKQDNAQILSRLEALQDEIDKMGADLRSPAFLADDASPEALIRKLEETKGQIATLTDEGRKVMKILMGIYSNGENREEIYVKCYDGSSPLQVDRATYGTRVKKPTASCLIMLQLDYLKKIGTQVDLFDSGYISRCIFCFPDSLAGTRLWQDRVMNREVLESYSQMIFTLLNQNYSRKLGQDKIFTLDADAKDAWTAYYNECEKAIAPGGSLHELADIATRFPEQARRIALVSAIVKGRGKVTVNEMEAGISLTRYYAIHAERAFSTMKGHTLPGEARRILQAIKKNQPEIFSARDICRLTGAKIEDVESGLRTLESLNYIRPKDSENGESAPTPGRRPSPVYETNPELFR